jgi:RHS repeat-associated protein
MATVRYTTLNGEVVAEKRGGARRLYQPDPLGSTVGLVDNTQTQTDTFSYWPYGEERVRTGSTQTPFRYVGVAGYYRDNSGRVYVRHRELSLTVGRWVSRDPARLLALATNLYRYALGNPVGAMDPSGLAASIVLSAKPDKNKWDCNKEWKNLRKAIEDATRTPKCDADLCKSLGKDLYNFFVGLAKDIHCFAKLQPKVCETFRWFRAHCKKSAPDKDTERDWEAKDSACGAAPPIL